MTQLADSPAATPFKEIIRAVPFLPSVCGDCVATARMSFEEYLLLDHTGLAEWVDGEVHLYMSVTSPHQRIVDFLSRLIGFVVSLVESGEVLTAPYAMAAVLGGPGREPDLMFIGRDHESRVTRSHLMGAPDLVVEVVSDDSVGRDNRTKRAEYQDAGIGEYWIIDSREGHVGESSFFVLVDGKYVERTPIDGVYRSQTIPGFWLRTEWLTQERPNALAAFREVEASLGTV
jgi:Uma2 family endonuclease